MRVLLTGAAGFIGSHLGRRLLQENIGVIGVDCFTDFYPRWMKERNLAPLVADDRFEFLPENILHLDLEKLLSRVEVVFHLAAQAGVRSSWGENFS
ncbi:MAG: NAD-dependent epimerase/dehydratase family protein, partial [Acidobacteriota bacterium]